MGTINSELTLEIQQVEGDERVAKVSAVEDVKDVLHYFCFFKKTTTIPTMNQFAVYWTNLLFTLC